MAWLVAGLGNPGDRYARSRHNVGRLVVEELAREADVRFRKGRFVPTDAAELRVADQRVVLARSHRFMNESGPSFAGMAKKVDAPSDRVIAVHDELDIPSGTLRVKMGGSTAGHNGLRSLERALRSAEFLRVRVGIGRPPGRQDPADFVLQPVAARDRPDFELLVRHAADAVRSLIADGLAVTQDRFNRSGPGGPPPRLPDS